MTAKQERLKKNEEERKKAEEDKARKLFDRKRQADEANARSIEERKAVLSAKDAKINRSLLSIGHKYLLYRLPHHTEMQYSWKYSVVFHNRSSIK